MKNFNKLIPQSLNSLIDEKDFSKAIAFILSEQQVVSNDTNINHYERNQRLGHLCFQRAVIAFAQNEPDQAFEFAKKSYQYDAFAFPCHPALITLALTIRTEETQTFASEVAWKFLTSYEFFESTDFISFWSKEDQDYVDRNGLFPYEDANAITKALEQYQDLPIVKQRLLENELFFARIRLDDFNEALSLIDFYEQKGLEKKRANEQRTAVLFNAEKYADVLSLWDNYDLNNITNDWVYLRLMISRIYRGIGLPEKLMLPNGSQVKEGYDQLTTFMTNLKVACNDVKECEKPSVKQIRERDELAHLLLWLGEFVDSIFQSVEQGKIINGYANSAHLYAMFCRNFSSVHRYLDNEEKALLLCEKGFYLSPFIENGAGMINCAINLGEYVRAEKNIDTVRQTLDGYLDFDSLLYLDVCYLMIQATKGVVPYFDALNAFNARYGDFLHAMRVNAMTESDLRPSAVVEWTCTHNVYIGNLESAVKLLYANNPEDSAVLAHYFEVQALTANRSQVAWCKEFTSNFKRILRDNNHPDYKANCFKAYAGYGYLKLKEGAYENDIASYYEGLTQLEKAVKIKTVAPRERADLYVKMGYTSYMKLEDYVRADKYLSEAINLLEEYGLKSNTLEELGFIGDPLLSYAYHFRGMARDKFPKHRPEDTVIADDFVKFCAINDSEDAYLSAYEVAFLSTLEKSRVDEQYQHALQYIDAVEQIQPDFEARGDVISTTVMNLLEFGDKERAEPLLETLKQDFPKHEDLPKIERIFKKMGKRKRFLGIF